MVLTGKAKEDFYKWYNCREGNTLTNNDLFYYSEELIQNALIIEWFDSVGIIINIGGVLQNGIYNFSFDIQENNTLNGVDKYGFDSRQEATKHAIIKANKIYNE